MSIENLRMDSSYAVYAILTQKLLFKFTLTLKIRIPNVRLCYLRVPILSSVLNQVTFLNLFHIIYFPIKRNRIYSEP